MSVTRQKDSTKSGLIALCGNPNCGKTTIFNAITGLSQQVGNYPGVTVDKVTGPFVAGDCDSCRYTLIDVPGTYSLSAFTPDEYIAASALFGEVKGEAAPDAIICVVDATNIERGLYLLFQIMQIGCPVVVALNMIDIVERHGDNIDADLLSKKLGGIPVVPVVGSRGRGIDRLKQETIGVVNRPFKPLLQRYDDVTESILADMSEWSNGHPRNRAQYLRVLFDVEGPAEKHFLDTEGSDAMEAVREGRERIREKFGLLSVAETMALTSRASEIHEAVVSSTAEPRQSTSKKVDKFLLHPILGPIVLIIMMTLVFQSIFSWSEPFMRLIEDLFGSIATLVGSGLAEGPLRSLLTDGVIGGVGSVLVFLPQIIILFMFISLLEDSGYMPRAAFLVDRMFRWCGLSGKSFIPMLSSFACAVPGIMATRTIEDRKLRFITIMVAPLMTCSARLPVYSIMIAAFIPYKSYLGLFNLQGLVLTLLYLLGIVVAVIVSFIAKKTLLKTEKGTFMMEMPSYKVPTVRSVAIRVLNRARHFVVRAGTVILAITSIIWALSYYPRSSTTTEQFESARAEITTAYESRLGQVSDEAARESLGLEYQASLTELENEHIGSTIRNSYLGRIGRAIAPVFRPLGWDWKITVAVLASFPAREVIIATLGTIYNLGADVDEESASLVDKMRMATWDDGPLIGKQVFTPSVALSIMIFFALCCQCGATLVTIKQETASWFYPLITFSYMTIIAYLGAMVAYQVFSRMGI